MKTFKQILSESAQVNSRIAQVVDYLKRNQKVGTLRLSQSGVGLEAADEASKSQYADQFFGHGSKELKGTVTFLHGMGDPKRGIHTVPWRTEGLGGGYGANMPYVNVASGLIFHHSNLEHAIAVYVHPESGLRDHFRSFVPPQIPVIHTDEVKSFLDSAGKKIDKNGQYTGPKIDVFGRTRKV